VIFSDRMRISHGEVVAFSIYSIHNNESYLKDRAQVIYYHVLRLRNSRKKEPKEEICSRWGRPTTG